MTSAAFMASRFRLRRDEATSRMVTWSGMLGLMGCLLAPVASAAADLTIRSAVQLSYPAAAGRGYVVEASTDLHQWRVHQPAILGRGDAVELFASAGGGAEFYRLQSHEVRDLGPLLEPIRARHGVPAVACAVVVSNRVVGIGAVGLRKAGVSNAPVTLDDKWHHGSLTKSMTATLAAMMVEKGEIRWSSTLAEIFPGVAPRMKPAWRDVTLDQLTSNRGGAPGNLNPSGIWSDLWAFQGTPVDARRLLLDRLTALDPASPPGTRYEYSNAGFALAGHMLETVAGVPWETLLTERLFRPLGMLTAGFGVPATPRYIDHPWGHQRVSGTVSPIEPGTSADNPPAIGPAGTVHCSVLDLARYAAFHTAGHSADTPWLTRSSMLKLHTAVPDNANYAHGWSEVDRPWAAPGKAYTHNGSNTQWFSVIWFAPARQFAVVALCNLATASGENPGAAATDQIAGRMIGEFL